MGERRIRVLVVDDSAFVRTMFAKHLSKYDSLEIVGTAANVYEARDLIVRERPDVLTLDIEMPGMNGLDFLSRLMGQYPMPVVMVSSLTTEGASATIEALERGAVDFVPKPKAGTPFNEMIDELAEKIRTAGNVDSDRLRASFSPQRRTAYEAAGRARTAHRCVTGSEVPSPVPEKPPADSACKVIAIGASTGGTTAILSLLSSLPKSLPGIVVVQHMPAGFTESFAKRIGTVTGFTSREAQSGMRVDPGNVYVAPGGRHLLVEHHGRELGLRVVDGPKVSGHAPSVDVMFHSVADNAGSAAIGVILTGMGRDGAAGMRAMRNRGARTLAQDKETSVVFGMPSEAFALGGAERLVPLDDIPEAILELFRT